MPPGLSTAGELPVLGVGAFVLAAAAEEPALEFEFYCETGLGAGLAG